MAVIINVELPTGLSVDQAYARIDTVSGYKGGIDITVNYYVSQHHFLIGATTLKQEIYSFVPSVEDGSLNYHKQGYEHIKTLTEFEGAVDVLEDGQSS